MGGEGVRQLCCILYAERFCARLKIATMHSAATHGAKAAAQEEHDQALELYSASSKPLILFGFHLCGLIGLLQHGAGGAAALAARCWASRGGQAASAAGRSAAAGSGVSAAREGNGGRESGHGEDGLRS